MVNGLESVADAIQVFEGWEPGTRSYENRNPGNLRLTGRTADERGYTIFPDLPTGYAALLRELQSKFSGNNSHGIGPSSTLLALFDIYAPPSDNNPTNAYAAFVADWVKRALGKPVTVTSPLSDIWCAPSTLDASDL
jgi:hypothetical protein